MSLFLSIGEAMVELSSAPDAGEDIWRLGFAGDTLNTAWYARACLPDDWDVQYMTRLGQDPFSPRLLDFLATNSIGHRFITTEASRSVGLYAIQLENGERSFAYWRGQSAARLLAEDPALLDEAFAASNAIYLSGITLAILPEKGRDALISRLSAARTAGKTTIFDPNLRPKLWESADSMRDWLTRAAAGAALVLPSFDDEAEWFGDTSPEACARRWQQAGAAEVVVKNGGGSMVILQDDRLDTRHAEKVSPVDSTGAGDSFNGGYLAARLTGSTPLEAAEAGHAIALKVIGHRGALIAMSDLKGAARSR
ncbi:sugar kinase [Tianweitania sp. BSSL-BM11]|uniref:Sugar kinase n=1 Tax=Tianweitania aestuarii TaxID=2814886 RepID=A0ABS5RYV8_9HYPH|nr:sugar kinase [Tianweitania aestuarii]MBS9721409.1 sugar kinase [Tianweitania aestuarii]